MSKPFKSAMIAIGVVSLGGCGTVANFAGFPGHPPIGGDQSIYGGVGVHVEALGKEFSGPDLLPAIGQVLFSLIDLPLSLGMDTVTLPITVFIAISRTSGKATPKSDKS